MWNSSALKSAHVTLLAHCDAQPGSSEDMFTVSFMGSKYVLQDIQTSKHDGKATDPEENHASLQACELSKEIHNRLFQGL